MTFVMIYLLSFIFLIILNSETFFEKQFKTYANKVERTNAYIKLINCEDDHKFFLRIRTIIIYSIIKTCVKYISKLILPKNVSIHSMKCILFEINSIMYEKNKHKNGVINPNEYQGIPYVNPESFHLTLFKIYNATPIIKIAPKDIKTTLFSFSEGCSLQYEPNNIPKERGISLTTIIRVLLISPSLFFLIKKTRTDKTANIKVEQSILLLDL